MLYSISSTSNRDDLLLHHYRILRGEQASLPAPFSTGDGQLLTFLTIGQPAGRFDKDGSPLYKYTAVVSVPANMVPMLEFEGNDNRLDTLADLRYVEVEADRINLLSTNQNLNSVKTTLYWYPTPEYYNQLFNLDGTSLGEQIEELVQETIKIRAELESIQLLIKENQSLSPVVKELESSLSELKQAVESQGKWIDEQKEESDDS